MTHRAARALEFLDTYDAYRWAESLFAERDYTAAAEVLEHVLRAGDDEESRGQFGAARELLTRSYYHSAQLDKAVDAARDLVRRSPDEPYAALLLSRSLQRSGRAAEAAEALRVAEALGA